MSNKKYPVVQSATSFKKALNRVREAQKVFATYTQEQVDKIFLAAATAANQARVELAKMAVEETGMGVAEDKVIKNHFASEYIYNTYRDTKTCGVIEEDKVFGTMKIAEPIGVIAAVIPTTNPTSTAIFKTLISLKTRNGIIISPHPRAKKSTIEASKIVLEAAVAAGAPEDIIAWIDVPSLELTNLLMQEADIILATGGPGMVKAAYSSGKPALGVGAGNTPAIIDDSADLGAFQAPANVSYAIIGLLYGNGDFGRSVCLAVNCGDDTDCSAATCGSVLGIIKGRSGIPEEWIAPIGEGIKTLAIDPFHAVAPATLGELTDRVIKCKLRADMDNPTLVRLTDGETAIGEDILSRLSDGSETARRVLSRSSRRLTQETPFGFFSVEYGSSPVTVPGETQTLTLAYFGAAHDDQTFSVRWNLPEGWSIEEGPEQRFMSYVNAGCRKLTVKLTAGAFSGAFEYIPVTFRLSGRNYPAYGIVPFQRAGTMAANGRHDVNQDYWDRFHRGNARRAE